MAERGYRVIYEALAEVGFQVIVPALPGIVTVAQLKRPVRRQRTRSRVIYKDCSRTKKRFPLILSAATPGDEG